MTQATKSITRKPQRPPRPATRKPSRADASSARARRIKPQDEPGAFGRPAQATVAARTKLVKWLSGGSLQRVDALRMTSFLLAAAVQEARAFLGPTHLTMALAAIGTVSEAVTGEDLDARVESILVGVAEGQL